jgi:hypothetical protein
MRYLLIALLLSGCSTLVPVAPKFPEKPSNVEQCPQLDTVSDNVKLSELTNTIVKNYGSYNECVVKVDTWNEWYDTQKKIYEGVSK